MNDTDDVINYKYLEKQDSGNSRCVCVSCSEGVKTWRFYRHPRAYHCGIDVCTVCKKKYLDRRILFWNGGILHYEYWIYKGELPTAVAR